MREMEYYIGEVKVSEQKFSKIYSQLSMSNMDWEIERLANRMTIYILG